MPSYDVRCSTCNYEAVIDLKISELDKWDSSAACPECAQKTPEFRRIIKSAPAAYGGAKSLARSQVSKKESQQKNFVSSGQKDDMRHQADKKRDRSKEREAVEIVKRGTYEGF